MNVKHTPGPWVFSDALGAQNLGIYPSYPDGHQLRGTICGNGIALMTADANGRANARLIAMAPEMAAFLSRMKCCYKAPEVADETCGYCIVCRAKKIESS